MKNGNILKKKSVNGGRLLVSKMKSENYLSLPENPLFIVDEDFKFFA